MWVEFVVLPLEADCPSADSEVDALAVLCMNSRRSHMSQRKQRNSFRAEQGWVLESVCHSSASIRANTRAGYAGHHVVEHKDEVRSVLAAYAGNVDFADYIIGVVNERNGCNETVTLDSGLRSIKPFRIL